MYVDLHLHLRGTVSAATARRLASRNGMTLREELLAAPGYGWTNFSSFLRAYDEVASVVATAVDFEEVAYCHLVAAAREGTGYVEFMLSPPHWERPGLRYADQLAAVEAAADRALEEGGIECRIIATAVRHLGPDAAIEAARTAVSARSRRLVGFGLTGDERRYDVTVFREAFAVARAGGLKTTAHAGEHLEPATILEAIDVLGLDRVGHGIQAAASPKVMEQLSSLGTPLEICITSNVALGLCRNIAEHPIVTLSESGYVITLGTDDPAFFSTTLPQEYEAANTAFPSLTADRISRCAIEAAFCDEETKARLRNRLTSSSRLT